jgi:hypothetical protein
MIITMLFNLYTLILYDEKTYIHYICSTVVFILIKLFMIRMTYINIITNDILIIILLISNIICFFNILINILYKKDIFKLEVIYLFNFTIFYLYYHFY